MQIPFVIKWIKQESRLLQLFWLLGFQKRRLRFTNGENYLASQKQNPSVRIVVREQDTGRRVHSLKSQGSIQVILVPEAYLSIWVAREAGGDDAATVAYEYRLTRPSTRMAQSLLRNEREKYEIPTDFGMPELLVFT